MISELKREDIRNLLRITGWSNTKIALRTGVSRGTVNRIVLLAGGRATMRGKPKPKPQQRPKQVDIKPSKGLDVRCPECGAKSPAPCFACRIRAMRKEGE